MAQTPSRSPIIFDNPEDSARAFAIVTEEDPFRLVIRGHALVEDALDWGINAAFREGTPSELKRMRLPARVALAEALELITSEVARAITTLAKIRNRLAHGGDDVVTAEEQQALREAFEPFIDEDIDLDNWDELVRLRIVVAGIWQATGFTVEYALEKRAELDAALAAWRKRGALSVEQIRELLGNEESGPDTPSN